MRYLVPIVFVLALVAGLVGIKFKQISGLIKMGEAGKKAGPPPEMVGTAAAGQASWENTLSAVGSIAVARGVTISSEAAGTVTAIRFDSGQTVRAGQVLVELDTSVERAQLASISARKDLADKSAERSRQLGQSGAISKAQLDSDEAQLKTAGADVAALRAQIERKTIKAPFAGRLGIRSVNLGQYLNPGTTVAMLESLGGLYVDFSLPQQELANVKVGTPIRIAFTDGGTASDADKAAGAEIAGSVTAVDPTIDAVTRTIKLRASLPANAANQSQLRPGMFVKVSVVVGAPSAVVIAPSVAVVHASYGDSVFVVEEQKGDDGVAKKIARQQFVKLGASRGDFVAIKDGVQSGQELVTAGAFKLRNGGSVIINNAVKPVPSQTPTVENR